MQFTPKDDQVESVVNLIQLMSRQRRGFRLFDRHLSKEFIKLFFSNPVAARISSNSWYDEAKLIVKALCSASKALCPYVDHLP